jgi:hypothetical protein
MYDILKWIAMILLPALGTFYFVLAGIWGWPYGEQVVGTIVALDTFLGVLLELSSAKYSNAVFPEQKKDVFYEERATDKPNLYDMPDPTKKEDLKP